MKQVININFHGRVVPIEVSAFDMLKSYTDSLAAFFANEEGKEEIINDIENRIGELFQERLKKGATCITEEDVTAIINSMGRPEDFDSDEEKVASGLGSGGHQKTYEQASASGADTATGTKRLYRDENNKVLGGVCGGLARYFNTDPVIIRVIFAVVALAFGTGLLAYIILWVAVPSSASKELGGVRKKLFRDPDDKIIAGVCSGIGNYFGINPWIPRVLFLLPFLTFVFHGGHWGGIDFPRLLNISFSPGSLIIYIILWLAIPIATTTAEKLEMKGEKVDMNSIKNSVMEEMKGVQQRTEKFAKEAATVAGEKGREMGAELKTVAKKSGTSLGDIIIFIVKAFVYFIAGCIGIALVIGLFTLAVVSIGLFPLKDFVLTEGWQNALAWGTLIFFIAVPVIGIITWIIRRLIKTKSNHNALVFSFISMWIIGWACFISLIASVGKDFRSVNNYTEETIALSNPAVDKLIVTTNSPMKNAYRYNAFKFEPFEGWEDDTVFVKNIDIKIVKATSDSFRATLVKMANGRTKRFADTLAAKIQFSALQNDSVLVVDKGIAINRNDKFRNQRIVLTLYVTVGKQIRIDRSMTWGNNNVHFDGPWHDDGDYFIDRDDEERGWHSNTDYIMKADGLYRMDGKKATEWDDNDDHETHVRIGPDGVEVHDEGTKVKVGPGGIQVDESTKKEGYRYNNNPVEKIDSLKKTLESEKQRTKDSLKKVKEEVEKQLNKISKAAPAGTGTYETVMQIPMLGIL
jgi:phage shock protein PspC (stress-responsive transcriptional regulator)